MGHLNGKPIRYIFHIGIWTFTTVKAGCTDPGIGIVDLQMNFTVKIILHT